VKRWSSARRGRATTKGSGHGKLGSILSVVWVAVRPTILSPARKRKLYPTAWLDGVRGLACFMVVFYHNGLLLYPGHCAAWKRDDPHFWRLPVARLPCSGPAMVDVFFVVSGYALSVRPLSFARAHDFPKAAETLSSGVFRRAIRLYTPVVFLTLTNAALSYFQLWDPAGADHVPYHSTGAFTFWAWLDDLMTGLNPFTLSKSRTWNMPGLRYAIGMWTIPFEFRGSTVVFVSLLALARVRPVWRSVLLLAGVLYSIAQGEWDIFLFLSGPICCEMHHYLDRPRKSAAGDDEKTTRPNRAVSLVKNIALVFGLAVLLAVVTMPEYPDGFGDVRFYHTLTVKDPESWKDLPGVGRFPVCVASALLVLYLGQSRFFRHVLSSPFPQYLGDNSFGIYLVHVTLINSVGRPLMRAVTSAKDAMGLRTGIAGQIGSWLVLLTYAAVAIPVLFWISELVTRYVDQKSVQLAKWSEQKCLKKE
jgi:peptidoglycan/LPS O-acetylase OafA/YrhL